MGWIGFLKFHVMAKGGELLIWASHTAKLNSTQAQQSHFKSTFGVHVSVILNVRATLLKRPTSEKKWLENVTLAALIKDRWGNESEVLRNWGTLRLSTTYTGYEDVQFSVRFKIDQRKKKTATCIVHSNCYVLWRKHQFSSSNGIVCSSWRKGMNIVLQDEISTTARRLPSGQNSHSAAPSWECQQ